MHSPAAQEPEVHVVDVHVHRRRRRAREPDPDLAADLQDEGGDEREVAGPLEAAASLGDGGRPGEPPERAVGEGDGPLELGAASRAEERVGPPEAGDGLAGEELPAERLDEPEPRARVRARRELQHQPDADVTVGVEGLPEPVTDPGVRGPVALVRRRHELALRGAIALDERGERVAGLARHLEPEPIEPLVEGGEPEARAEVDAVPGFPAELGEVHLLPDPDERARALRLGVALVGEEPVHPEEGLEDAPLDVGVADVEPARLTRLLARLDPDRWPPD